MNLLCFLILSWSSQAFDFQGHRGARGLFPENSIIAMKEAMKYPISTLEMDVVISKDNKVVVSHEPWMSEEICLNKEGKTVKDREFNLYKMNYDEIAKFDCGSKSHPRFQRQSKVKTYKPLLSEVLSEFKKSKLKFSIEIKSTELDEKTGFQPEYKIFTDLVMKVIKSKINVNQVMIQSFDWRVLRYLHQAYPTYKTVALIEEKFKAGDVISKLGFTPTVFSPAYDMITPDVVKYFHQKKVLVIPWTVNELEHIKQLQQLGVDGIITDYPDLLLKLP